MKWKQFFTPAKSMDAGEARSYLQNHPEGTFTLLDVRQPGEFEQSRIPGAKLIPLPELPGRTSELDPGKPVIRNQNITASAHNPPVHLIFF